jgi:hypothetical protein
VLPNWTTFAQEFIPHFAEEYDFQYELVTYKWPTWLRQQREKQRIIWAYKILFLDVLFPMDLDKVIFVDADQIVRTDLKELIDVDLHGAPYGYTPMGEITRTWRLPVLEDGILGTVLARAPLSYQVVLVVSALGGTD